MEKSLSIKRSQKYQKTVHQRKSKEEVFKEFIITETNTRDLEFALKKIERKVYEFNLLTGISS